MARKYSVDAIEDHSEKSWKIYLGDASAYMPKSQSSRNRCAPNEIIVEPKFYFVMSKLEKKAQELVEVA